MSSSQSKPEDFDRAVRLIDLLQDEPLAFPEKEVLDSLVCRFSDVRRYYILAMSLHADLVAEHTSAITEASSEPRLDETEAFVPSMSDSIITQAITEETTSEPEDCPDPKAVVPQPQHSTAPEKRKIIPRYAAILMIGVSVAILASMWHFAHRTSPDRPKSIVASGYISLAQIDLSLHPILESTSAVDTAGSVHPGNLNLQSGTARLITSTGVEITLEAPVMISIEKEGSLKLRRGRLSVRAPHTAPGYSVVTSSATVTDIGTEFGVSANPDGAGDKTQTKVVVFEGSVNINPGGAGGSSGGQVVGPGQAYVVSSAGIINETPELGESFIRTSDFDQRKLAMHNTLARVMDPGILAYSLFDTEFERFAAAEGFSGGMTQRSVIGPSPANVEEHSIAAGKHADGTLTLRGRQAVMLDIDTSPRSKFAKAGYLGPEGFIETSGKTLYLAWTSTLLQTDPNGFGGLSLTDGDREVDNEYIFIGQTAYGTNSFGAQAWKSSREKSTVLQQFPIKPVDNLTHLWVMKIEFLPGNDRISIFFDPPALEPSTANVVITQVDLRFNKLLLNSGNGCTVQFTNIALGTSYSAAILKDHSIDNPK
jgi:hypothetical protein